MYFELSPLRRSSALVGPSLEKEFEKVFDALNDTPATFSPSCEIRENETQFALSLDVPGLKKEEISIEVDDHRLTISGERLAQTSEGKESVLRNERRFGKFSRTFTLPQTASTERIEARFESGVLDIIIPKEEKALPRKIPIGDWTASPAIKN